MTLDANPQFIQWLTADTTAQAGRETGEAQQQEKQSHLAVVRYSILRRKRRVPVCNTRKGRR